MLTLSACIQAEFPQTIPMAAVEWDKAGAVVLAEAKVVVTTFGVGYTTVPAPSASRILAAVAGGPFADARYAAKSMLAGMSVGFDTAQAAVVAGYATQPIPILPPASEPPEEALKQIIYTAYRADLSGSNPDFAKYPETANVQKIMSAMAKFIYSAYI